MPDLLDIALSDWGTSYLTPSSSGPSHQDAEGQPGPQGGMASAALAARFTGRGTGRFSRLIFRRAIVAPR
jgi:hypothetical protein